MAPPIPYECMGIPKIQATVEECSSKNMSFTLKSHTPKTTIRCYIKHIMLKTAACQSFKKRVGANTVRYNRTKSQTTNSAGLQFTIIIYNNIKKVENGVSHSRDVFTIIIVIVII